MKFFDIITNFFSEFFATFILMCLGCMGCVETEKWTNSFLQLCFNFGLIVMISIQSFGIVSGSHINPSVTLCALILGRVSILTAGYYVVAQLLGACVGYGVLKVLLTPEAVNGLCLTKVHPDLTIWQGIAIEFILTGVLAWFCCGVWDQRNAAHHDSVSLRFGLMISSLALTGGQFTGASMNPVRSFAPALWNVDFDGHWIYWVAPLAGSGLFTALYRYLFRRQVKEKAEDLPRS